MHLLLPEPVVVGLGVPGFGVPGIICPSTSALTPGVAGTGEVKGAGTLDAEAGADASGAGLLFCLVLPFDFPLDAA